MSLRPTLVASSLLFAGVGIHGCRKPPTADPPSVSHLVDVFTPAAIEGRAPTARVAPRSEWRFDGPPPAPPPREFPETRGWQAGSEVADLVIIEGLLTGRSTGEFPLIRVARTVGMDHPDLLHAVEVRMRASAGIGVSVAFRNTETVDFATVREKLREDLLSAMGSPLIPGDEFHTYTLRWDLALKSSDLRHLILRPTDVSDATFEIESVRLILRKEHLASIPSGLGWHGLSEIYRESIVSRVGETVRLATALPPRPWLDMALGTLEDGPVTFRISVTPGRTAVAATAATVLERTITTPHRWEPAPVELADFTGQDVTLGFSISSENAGALGLWGSPVVRSRGSRLPGTGGSGRAPQGVILIWADTLRRDHLDVYGYARETAPVLRRMAGEGALFSDCLVQATWTKVSTPSLFTGLYPASHGVAEFPDRLPASAVTLAEVFRKAGYATLSMSSILFTGRFSNLDQGFEELHESSSLSRRGNTKTARELVDRLLPWLTAHRDVPFFVFLHPSDPHDPYEPDPPYDALWANSAWKQEHQEQGKKVREFIADPLMKLFGMPTRDELMQAGFDAQQYIARERDWYDGSIRGMDAEIGRLLEHLRTLGLDSKTLVVFTSDHGEEFLEHGRMFHGQSVYGELCQVPLILCWPGAIPAASVVDETVESIDVMPTLLELCGVAAPDDVQGRSLVPLLAQDRSAGEGNARPAIVQKAATHKDKLGPPPRETESFAIVLDGWKLVHNTQRADGRPEFELYDHRTDPLDLTDVAVAHPEIRQRLAESLAAWRASALAAKLKSDADVSLRLSAEELERLRSLGYIR